MIGKSSSRSYDSDWAFGLYPEICQACPIVEDAIDTMLPLINDSSKSDEDRSLEITALYLHVHEIKEKCIKYFLVAAGFDLRDVWPEDDMCWLLNQK